MWLDQNVTSCHWKLTLVTKHPQGKVHRGFQLLQIEWRSRKTRTIAQWVVVHCKARCINSLHGALPSLLSSFLLPSRQPWEQLPEWLECSGDCRYVQAQLFAHFSQEILQLVLPHGCITKPDLIYWIEGACILVCRFLPKGIASWISFYSCAVWRINCKMGSVSSLWCNYWACKFITAYICHVRHMGFFEKVHYFRRNCAFALVW